MQSCLSSARLRGSLLASAALVFGASVFGVQGQQGSKDAITRAFDRTAQRRTELRDGKEQAKNDKTDKDVADAAAQWYIYRITWKPAKDEHFALVQRELESEMIRVASAKGAKAYAQMLGAALVLSMKDVLGANINEDPTTFINACMMLPAMAKLKQENIADFLIDKVKDAKTDDVVRLYALKALKEFFPVTPQNEDIGDDLRDNKAVQARVRLDTKVVDVLAKYVEKPNKTDSLSAEDMGVIHYFRREAVSSLAYAGVPAVVAIKKPARIEGAVAPTLLKVLTKNGVQPPANMQEKIEAALGICAMKYSNMPEYEPDAGVYLVGTALLEFIDEYRADWANFAGKGAARTLPRVAWKTDSKRFEAGLQQLSSNATGGTKAKADQLRALAQPLLASMYQYAQPPGNKAFDLKNEVQQMRPKTGALFKSAPAISVPLP